MRKTFGVIGLGRFGFYVAKTLSEAGAEVIALDKDPDRVKKVSDFVTHAYITDALEEKALEESGILNADTVILSVGQNVEASILVAVLLVSRGVKEVIAKAINPLHGEVLKRLGVSRIIYPEKEMAIKLAKSLMLSGVLQELPFAPGYSIFELKAPRKLDGRTLRQLDLRNKLGVSVLAIKRGNEVVVNPTADAVIKEGDILLVLASEDSVAKLQES
ncbi:MAG: TrkA family potassium uptake protein [Aquificae bacterium]|nr:TrkA family potassium uptake protein [Aquificota bacterium]